jgi:hypothetical protein
MEKMQVLFEFYDFDRDGHISSLDILNLVEAVPDGSYFHREVKLVADFFISESITRRINKRPCDFFRFENFRILMSSSEVSDAFEKWGMFESYIIGEFKNGLC